MNRIDTTFMNLRATGRRGIIAYLTAGDPDLGTTEELVCRLARSGADMIELGVPFSDPLADGPVIQAASARALKEGVTLQDVLDLAARLRNKTNIPLLAMTYYNPVFVFGPERFAKKASESGLDGAIVPDLPLEESTALRESLHQFGLHYIYLLSPTTTPGRIAATAGVAGGFIYCISVTGVTGERDNIPVPGRELPARVRSHTDLPLAMGFGFSRPEQVASLGEETDAVIIGSAIVRLVEKGGKREEILNRVGSYLKRFG